MEEAINLTYQATKVQLWGRQPMGATLPAALTRRPSRRSRRGLTAPRVKNDTSFCSSFAASYTLSLDRSALRKEARFPACTCNATSFVEEIPLLPQMKETSPLPTKDAISV